MKLMMVLSRIPFPLEKGDKLRSFHQMRTLSVSNEIFLFCVSRKKLSKEAELFLSPYCSKIKVVSISRVSLLFSVLKAFFKLRPFQSEYYSNRNIRREYDRFEEQNNVDCVYCQLVRTAEIVRNSIRLKLIDYQDALSKNMLHRFSISPFYMKPLFYYEACTLKRYERELFDRFNACTIISEPDREAIDHPLRKQIHIIPNGVDFEYFSPIQQDKKLYDIVFTGNMQYPPNIDAAIFLVKRVMPLIWESQPTIKVLIAGAEPTLLVRNLSSKRVIVSGWMDDIRTAYTSSKIFVAPMKVGTGLQNKLLEAMAMKIPCVTSPLVNQALAATEGRELLLAEKAEEYAGEVKRLLNNPVLYKELSENAFSFVHTHFDWESHGRKLDCLLKETVEFFHPENKFDLKESLDKKKS